jgi:hypothetical protein
MGSSSTQGVAVLLFLVAFTCLGGSLFFDGSLLLVLLFLVCAAASIALFWKVKPLEQAKG